MKTLKCSEIVAVTLLFAAILSIPQLSLAADKDARGSFYRENVTVERLSFDNNTIVFGGKEHPLPSPAEVYSDGELDGEMPSSREYYGEWLRSGLEVVAVFKSDPEGDRKGVLVRLEQTK